MHTVTAAPQTDNQPSANLMMTHHPASITRIPTSAFFAAPLLYGCVLGLHVLFPSFGYQYLLQPLPLFVLPCILLPTLLPVLLPLLAASSRA